MPPYLKPLLVSPDHRADFTGRFPEVETSTDRDATLARLRPPHESAAQQLGFSKTFFAEQVHGAEIEVVGEETSTMSAGVDGLVTDKAGILLGIYVADCGAVYLVDQKTGALGVLHSGRKGTELEITPRAIALMTSKFGTNPADLIAVLGPCIRPPHYEVDIASEIARQAVAAGIREENFHDCGLCTASDLSNFYSYRIEKGNTGRHLALLGRHAS